MTVAEIVNATNDDMVRFYGSPILSPWEGKVMKEGRHILGFAGVLVLDDGTLWGFMDIRNKSRSKMVFRHIMLYLKELKERGVDKVKVAADTDFDKAEHFLKRLGFRPTDDFDKNGMRVWQCQVSKL